MNCKDFLKEITKGKMSSNSLDHVEFCESCKEILLNIDKQIEEVGKDKLTETNPFFYTKVKQRLENRQTKPFYNKQFIIRLRNVSSLIITGMFLGLLFFKQFGGAIQIGKENRREQIIESMMNDHFLINKSKSISVFDSESE